MPIIRKEKITKPRILFLDFDPMVVDAIEKKGYVTIYGDSGFSGKPTKISQHPSEVEIIYWDCTKFKELSHKMYFDPVYDTAKNLIPYFNYVKQKGGIVTVILSKEKAFSEYISKSIGYDFQTAWRETTNVIPPDFDNFPEEELGRARYLKPLLERFVQDENIKHSIVWNDNFVGYFPFFSDEDDNKFVSFNDNGLLIFPFVSLQKDFIISTLQDCFPYITDENIFPDVHNVTWLNDDEFIYPEIKSLENTIRNTRQKAQKEISRVEKKIEVMCKRVSFLNQALIADDSDAFGDEDKLKLQIVKMLKTLGFKVTDLDEENEKLRQALKEDIQLHDEDYFALVEVKGTERGAKASWVKIDLNAHITEFARIKTIEPHKLASMLIFNHDRRTKPGDRSQPFAGDPDLITYCKESNITLIPIYELYKLCVSVLTGKKNIVEARTAIKKPGLYSF
jgi:hypothetical protein